ncbi:class II fructose-bisphosphate aldolase [Rhodobacteraceae bacterium RKSG542]|uniref:class II fructose-bisphosphate aldolase n=1 Tax=Pseudovibrio flavus TaxID=2529854 RepID=UPI003528E66D|nr:class II fructose-bisphosphate aldolase [Pseudovibrio flavus]
MPLVSLDKVLKPAFDEHYAVAGVVCLGWEDARAYVEAAEEENLPIVLQAGPGCRRHTPLPIVAKMLRTLGENASVPVVVHLDHGYNADECFQAMDCGFTSVMFDGSHKPVSENIEISARIVEAARKHGITVEGEVGVVGYAGGEASESSSVEDVVRYATESGVDAVAISVGNVHLQTEKAAVIDFERIREIEKGTSIPLVLHGGSGIAPDVRRKLAMETNICKFNVGTELRKAFGDALRDALARDPNRFDRLALLSETEAPVKLVAREVLRNLRARP